MSFLGQVQRVSLRIGEVLCEDGLDRDESRYLASIRATWELNPDIPHVVLIGSDPSPDRIPGNPAFSREGRRNSEFVEIPSTKNLLNTFKLLPELYETAARFNVYPVMLPNETWKRYVADDKCFDGVVPFVASRMTALFSALPQSSTMWVAALGRVASFAVRRHLELDIDETSGYPRNFVFKKYKLVATGHPVKPRASCVDEFGKWLDSGLREGIKPYATRLQAAHELRAAKETQLRAVKRAFLAAQQKKPTVRVGDTITIRYLDNGRPLTVTLVRDEHHNTAKHMIGVSHPLGKALEGAKLGEEKEYVLGKLRIEFVVDEIVKAAETELV